MLIQVISIAGSFLILGAFIAGQLRRLEPSSLLYLVLNFSGSGILAVVAFIGQQWGFLLLEGVWALVSLWGMLQALRGASDGLRR